MSCKHLDVPSPVHLSLLTCHWGSEIPIMEKAPLNYFNVMVLLILSLLVSRKSYYLMIS